MKKKIKIESFVVQKENLDELKNHIGGYDSYYTDVVDAGTNGCTGRHNPGDGRDTSPPRNGSTGPLPPDPGTPDNNPGDGEYDSNYTAIFSGC